MPIKIGLAEDNVNLRKSIANNMSLFEEVELLFIGANGIEVLHLLEEHKPDLILMDINMPQMDGLDFIEQVNQKFSQDILSIFLITAELSHTVRLRAFKNGVNRVFEKPLDFQELCNAVDWVTKFDTPHSTNPKYSSARQA